MCCLSSIFRSQFPVFKVLRARPGTGPVAARETTIRVRDRARAAPGALHDSHTTGGRGTGMPLVGQRRPALPRTDSAVPSALGGLTSGFGMGPGVPPLPWPPTSEGRSLPEGPAWRRALRAAQRDADDAPRRGPHRTRRPDAKGRARPISTARLSASRRLHLQPITSWSTRGLTEGRTHLGTGFPLRCFQRLSQPDSATGRCRWSTTRAPEVRPPRSSRTRGSPPQFSYARGG